MGGGLDATQGVGVDLEGLRLSLGQRWRDAPLGLRLALTDTRTGRTATGAVRTRFVRAVGTGLADIEFRTSPEGELEWMQFPPPGQPEPRDQGHAELAAIERGDAPGQTVRVSLVIAHLETGEPLVLEGPVLERLDAWMDVERPVMRRLGLLQTLNPFQRGGLWDAVRHARRYARCTRLRDAAQAELKRRFEEQIPRLDRSERETEY